MVEAISSSLCKEPYYTLWNHSEGRERQEALREEGLACSLESPSVLSALPGSWVNASFPVSLDVPPPDASATGIALRFHAMVVQGFEVKLSHKL